MSKADITLLVFLALGAWRGFRNGFLLSVFTVVGVILGVLGGIKLMDQAMIYLQKEFNADEKFLPYISFFVVFILIVIVMRLLGNMVKYSIDDTFLGKADKITGAMLGMFKYAFSVSITLWITESLQLMIPETWSGESFLLPHVRKIAPWMSEMIPFFRDLIPLG